MSSSGLKMGIFLFAKLLIRSKKKPTELQKPKISILNRFYLTNEKL